MASLRQSLPASLTLLIAALAAGAGVGLGLTASDTVESVRHHGVQAVGLLGITLLLQAGSIRVGRRGSMSVSAIGVLAAGFALGPGPAMAIALVAAIVQWIRRRGALHRAVFDVANFSVTAAAGAGVYALLTTGESTGGAKVGAAALAAIAYMAANLLPLCLAMSLTEGVRVLAVWRDRFSWLAPHYPVFGLLAVAATLAYDRVGLIALVALALPWAAVLVGHRRLIPAH